MLRAVSTAVLFLATAIGYGQNLLVTAKKASTHSVYSKGDSPFLVTGFESCELPNSLEANAGNDLVTGVGSRLLLNGTGSCDANNLPLQFAWRLLEKPVGSNAALADSQTVAPSLTPDLHGVYLVELEVTNGQQRSAPDWVFAV
jgi:hypothetical protein